MLMKGCTLNALGLCFKKEKHGQLKMLYLAQYIKLQNGKSYTQLGKLIYQGYENRNVKLNWIKNSGLKALKI